MFIYIHGHRVHIICEKMFTVSEIQPISDANERKRQTQQHWTQYVAANPNPRTLPPKLRLEREW